MRRGVLELLPARLRSIGFRHGVVFVFLILVFSTILPALFAIPIGGSSEAREAQVVRVMLEKGEWFLPLRNGLVPSKPPLFHWVGSFFAFFLSDAGEFSHRFPSFLAAFGICVLIFRLARTLVSRVSSYTSVWGDLIAGGSVFILLTSYCFARMVGDGRVDMVLSFFVVLAVWLLLSRVRVAPGGASIDCNLPGWKGYLLFFLICSLGVLTKGPLGLVLPVLILFSIFLYLGGVRQAIHFIRAPGLLWIVPFILPALYYFFAFSGSGGENGTLLVGRQIVFENIQRFVGSGGITPRPVWYYIPSALRGLFPWSLVVLFVFYKLTASSDTEASDEKIARRLSRIGFVWFVAGVVFLSLAAGKRHAYLLPLVPGFALSLSWSIAELIRRRGVELSQLYRWISRCYPFFGFLLCGTILIFELVRLPWAIPAEVFQASGVWIRGSIPFFEIAVSVSLVTFLFARCLSQSKAQATRLFGVSIAVLLFATIHLGSGIKNNLRAFKSVALEVSGAVPEDADFVCLLDRGQEFFDPLFYYLKREVRLIFDEGEKIPEGAFVMMSYRTLEKLEDLDTARLLVHHRQFGDYERRRKDREIVLLAPAG